MADTPTRFDAYKASAERALEVIDEEDLREVDLQLALVHATLALAHATADIAVAVEQR